MNLTVLQIRSHITTLKMDGEERVTLENNILIECHITKDKINNRSTVF